jgi:hypothetical protein
MNRPQVKNVVDETLDNWRRRLTQEKDPKENKIEKF